MTPNECLLLWTALKLHFTTPNYDYFKYQGKLKHPPRFEKRKDKHFFAWLAQKDDPKGLIIANLIKTPTIFVGDLFSADAQENYLNYKKRQESLTYVYTEDLEKLDFSTCFKVKDGQHPDLLKAYLQGDVCLETLVILDAYIHFTRLNWDINLKEDPIWQSIRLVVTKYFNFLTYDREKIRKITLDKIRGMW